MNTDADTALLYVCVDVLDGSVRGAIIKTADGHGSTSLRSECTTLKSERKRSMAGQGQISL